MMLKKLKASIALLMILTLVVSLAACSKPKQTSALEDEFDKYVDALESELDNMTFDHDETEDVDETEDSQDQDNDTSDILPEFDKNADIAETVLAETFGVRITATGIEVNSYSVDVQLKIENLTDSTREVYSGTAAYCCNSVNGYMIQDGYLNCTVESGETAEDDVSFSKVELNARGITQIADIELAFSISDEDYHSENTAPASIKTNLSGRYNYSEDTYLKTIKGKSLQNAYGIKIEKVLEEELYSEGGVTMISEALMTNKDDETSLMLEFENHADQTLYVVLSALSVNGISAYESRFVSDMVCPDKRLVSSAKLSSLIKDVSALSGQKITSVSFDVELYNADYQNVTQGQTVTINF